MNGKSETVRAEVPVPTTPARVVALPDLAGIKSSVERDLEELFQAQGAKGWSPGLGLAITGLRSALHGLEAHEAKQKQP